MRFRVINIVDSMARVNTGIWLAAVNTAPYLAANHDVGCEVWYPAGSKEEGIQLPHQLVERQLPGTSLKVLKEMVSELNPSRDVIVTHGSWRYPTKWGAWLRMQGFQWIYVPQGMLEPWSMAQKSLKKRIYWAFVEGPRAKRASGIRAVSRPERQNLLRRFRSVILIPNGHTSRPANFTRPQLPLQFLFLSRLHYKKQPTKLAQAFAQSPLAGKPEYRLIIAGPDEGEFKKVEASITGLAANNTVLTEPLYGQDKESVFRHSHFFVLPSQSEGFPSAVVEAMSEGLIPIISDGCNFPEAFENRVAINCGFEVETIRAAIEVAAGMSLQDRIDMQNRCRQFAVRNYSLEVIARHQAFWYSALLGLHANNESIRALTDK